MGFLSQPPTTTLLGDLFPLHCVTKVLLHDVWIGMRGPRVALFDLLRTPEGGLRGIRRCFEREGPERHAEVELSPELVREGFGHMARARCVPGAYTPSLDHTDDYPSLTATLVADPDREKWGHGGLLGIASSSQHRHRLPWGITYEGNAYTVFGPNLARAFLLWESLQEETDDQRPERAVVLDGAAFDDLDGFFATLSRAIGRDLRHVGQLWEHAGGFDVTLRWIHSGRSQRVLDHAALARWLAQDPRHVPAMDLDDTATARARARAALAEEGPSAFDLLVRHLDAVLDLRLE